VQRAILVSATTWLLVLAGCTSNDAVATTDASVAPLRGGGGGHASGRCPVGTTNCRGKCVILEADENNCGGCSVVCPGGWDCVAGMCTADSGASDAATDTSADALPDATPDVVDDVGADTDSGASDVATDTSADALPDATPDVVDDVGADDVGADDVGADTDSGASDAATDTSADALPDAAPETSFCLVPGTPCSLEGDPRLGQCCYGLVCVDISPYPVCL
jgi:hypothetical protein